MSLYLDDRQRQEIQRLRASWRWRSEWPTWLLIVGIYGGWFGVALNARTLGMPLALGALAVLSCWYMSLQHELLHGHPTRSALVNALFGVAPLAVWFPYAVYRESHLRHHDDEHLTDPARDPESYFVSAQRWKAAGAGMRLLLALRNTFVGRLLLGPAFSIAGALRDLGIAILRRDVLTVGSWALHGTLLVALAYWLDRRCGIGWFAFVFGVGYPALALGAVRSFHEHRAVEDAPQRTVINEAGWFWRLLFLNNNYHAVHHDLPCVPWFALGTVYRGRRAAYAERNGRFVVHGYGEWLAKFAVSMVAPVVHPVLHPLGRQAAEASVRPAAQAATRLRTARESDPARLEPATPRTAAVAMRAAPVTPNAALIVHTRPQSAHEHLAFAKVTANDASTRLAS
jgi:fatty acid desaturase